MTAPIKGRDVTSELPAGHARLLEKAKRCAPLTTAVVHPVDDLSLEGVVAAAAEGLIEPLLVGPEARIRRAADEAGLDISGFEIVGCPHSEAAAARGVALAREGRVESLMKGALHTDELMKAVLDADLGPHAVGAVRDHIQWRSPARRPTQFRRFGWPTAPYLNSGVMLMDLPACRAMDLLPRAVDLGRREKARLVGHDQTLINCLLRGAFAELSPVWNWQYSKYGRLAEAMVDELLPRADLVVPNHYELDHLTGARTTTRARTCAWPGAPQACACCAPRAGKLGVTSGARVRTTTRSTPSTSAAWAAARSLSAELRAKPSR